MKMIYRTPLDRWGWRNFFADNGQRYSSNGVAIIAYRWHPKQVRWVQAKIRNQARWLAIGAAVYAAWADQSIPER